MKKNLIASIGLITLMTLSLSACSTNTKEQTTTADTQNTSDNSDESKKGSDSLTVMIPEWAVPSDSLIQEFTKETGINVTINQVDWDAIRDKISIASSGGEASADEADWLEPLTVDDSLKEDMTTLSTFSVDGKTLAIPYSNDYRIAYYNTKQFAEAGITQAPKTYDEVYTAVKAIKDAGIAEHPYPLVLTAEKKASTGLIWTAYTMNDVVFNADGTLNESSVKDALNFYDKLIKEDLIDPADKTADGGKTYERLTDGSASYLTGPTSYISTVQNKEKSKVVGEVTPILMPGKSDTAKHTMALPEALGITKFSKNKEAARKFIDWYTSADIQEKLNEELGNLPTRNSVLEKLVSEGKIENPGAMIEQAKLIASPFPHGVPVYYNEMSNAIYNAVNGMALGNLNVDEAFTQMNDKIKEIISENK